MVVKRTIYSCDSCKKTDLPLFNETTTPSKDFLYSVHLPDLCKTLHLCKECWEKTFPFLQDRTPWDLHAAELRLVRHHWKYGHLGEEPTYEQEHDE